MSRLAVRISMMLAGVLRGLVGVSLLLLVLLALTQALIRNLRLPLFPGIDALLHEAVLAFGLLGAVIAVRRKSHLRIATFRRRLSARHAFMARVADAVLGGLSSLAFFGASLKFAASELASGGVGAAGALLISAVFLLMAVQFCLEPFLPTAAEEGPSP